MSVYWYIPEYDSEVRFPLVCESHLFTFQAWVESSNPRPSQQVPLPVHSLLTLQYSRASMCVTLDRMVDRIYNAISFVRIRRKYSAKYPFPAVLLMAAPLTLGP